MIHSAVRCTAAIALAVAALGAASAPAGASTIQIPCSASALVGAISGANAIGGADTIALPASSGTCVMTLTQPDNFWFGPNGLPPIASDITIEGNGATIERAPGAPAFRLFFVGADPTSGHTHRYVTPLPQLPGPRRLTLRGLTVRGGLALGGSAGQGGAGAGMGGAIYAMAPLALDAVTITGSVARGGDTIAALGKAGGGIGADSHGDGGAGMGPGAFGGPAGGAVRGLPGAGGGGFATGDVGSSGQDDFGGRGGGATTGTGGEGGSLEMTEASGDGSGGGGGAFGEDEPYQHGGAGGAFGEGGGQPMLGGGGGGGVGGGGGAGQAGGGGGGGFGGGGGAGDFGAGAGGFGGGGGAGRSRPDQAGAGGFGGGRGGCTSPCATKTTGGGGAGLGGAVFLHQAALTAVNSTIAGNSAVGGIAAGEHAGNGSGFGGGVFVVNGALTLTASTVATNGAVQGGGNVFVAAYDWADERLSWASLAGSVVGPASSGSNLVLWSPELIDGHGNGSTARLTFAAGGNVLTGGSSNVGTPPIVGTATSTADPQLGPLADHGGPGMFTMEPSVGSPAHDASGGTCAATTDERGVARPASGCDLGALDIGPPGFEVSPASPFDFKERDLGTTTPQTFTVTNSGDAPLEIGILGLQGGDADQFALAAAGDTCTGATLPSAGPGNTCTVTVEFSPTSGGAKHTTLQVPDNTGGPDGVALTGTALAPGFEVAPGASFGFGGRNAGATAAQLFTVTNSGDAPLTIGTVGVTGGEADQFAVPPSSDDCASTTVAPEHTCTVAVVFAPTSTGPKQTTLRFADDAGNPDDVALSGTGTAPGFSVAPGPSYGFGSPLVGTQAERAFTVTNTGDGPMVIGAVTVVGADATQFVLPAARNTCVGQMLEPTQTCQVDATFRPTTEGPKQATLRFAHDAGTSGDVALSGTGVNSPSPPLPAPTPPAPPVFPVPPGPPLKATISVRSSSLTANRKGTVALRLRCSGGLTCRGRLVIRSTKAVKVGRSKKKRAITFAADRAWSLRSGRTATTTLRLSRTNLAVLARLGKVRVVVTAGAAKRTVTLRAASR